MKCHFSCTDRSFLQASEDTAFCMDTSEDGQFKLKKKHAYFYQIQLQMKLCEVDYGNCHLECSRACFS